MRRQRRHGGIGVGLQHHGPVGAQCLVPRLADRLGRIDPDAAQADQLRVAGVGEVRKALRALEFGITRLGALLPGHLVQVAVVQHHHDQPRVLPASPIFGDRDQFAVAVHLHRPIADKCDGRAIGKGKLGGDDVGHARPHGGQPAGQRGLHAAAHPQVTGVPVGGRAGIGGEDGVVRQSGRELPEHPLRVDGIGLGQRPPLHQRPPVADVGFDPLLPLALCLVLEQRQQRLQRTGGIALQVDLHRVAQAEHLGVDVDLHAARLALGGQELAVGEAGADHQQRVALLHHLPAWAGAEQADRAGDVGQVVRHGGLAEQRLGHTGAHPLSDLDYLLGRAERAGADQHRHPLAGVEHLGGTGEIGRRRHHDGRLIADARMHRAVCARRDRYRLELLDVIGDDDAGDGAPRLGDAHRTVHGMTQLRRRRDHRHVLVGHVLEQRDQVHLLLIMPAERRSRLLAHDRHDRRVIELGVVQPVQQVDGPGAGGRQAQPHLTRELGMGAGHEGGHLLMPRLDEVDVLAGPVDGADDAVDAVARIAIDALEPPLVEPLQQKIADALAHDHPPVLPHRMMPIRCATDASGASSTNSGRRRLACGSGFGEIEGRRWTRRTAAERTQDE